MKKRSQIVLLVSALLTGCSNSDLTAPSMELPKVPLAGLNIRTRTVPAAVGLYSGKRIVPVGGNKDSFLVAFPRPSRGFPLEQVVPGLPKEYVSEGWETDKEGAGAIFLDDQLVLAMHQYEALDAAEFAEALKIAQDGFGNNKFNFLATDQADYWFSQTEDAEACVISRLRGQKKTYQVTITVGDIELLKFLKIYSDKMKSETTSVAK
jgi:hypothetical protein